MSIKTLGIILILIGTIMIAYTGFHYVTTENVVDLGPIEINKEKEHAIQWSPFIGVAILVGGIILVLVNKKNSN